MQKRKRTFIDELLTGRDGRGSRAPRLRALIVLVTMVPIITLAAISLFRINDATTDATLRRREAVAQLAASTLRTRFDQLSAMMESVVEDERLRSAAETGDWEAAIQTYRGLVETELGVDRVTLTDSFANAVADYPTAEGIIGRNFAERDWYQGVIRTGRVYVSDAYKRLAEPQVNVVMVAAPVRGANGEIVAVAGAQVTTDTLVTWTRSFGLGNDSFVFFADRSGRAVGHPRFAPDAPLENMYAYRPVERALSSDRGVSIITDPYLGEDVIAAYEPVVRYGWAAVVEQPARTAFASRFGDLRITAMVFGIILLINVLLAMFLMRAVTLILTLRSRETSFIRGMSDGVIVVSQAGDTLAMNPAAELMLGMREKDAVGKPFADVVRMLAADGKPLHADREVLTRSAANHPTLRATLVAADGKQTPIQATAVPHEGGETIVSLRDMSREEELIRARREFVSITSHQLLTPVAAAKGFLSMLIAGDLGKIQNSQKEYLTKLYTLNQRMIEIIDDLLNMSRLELGAVETVADVVDVEDFLRQEAEAVAPLALGKQITLTQEYGEHMPPLRVANRLFRIIAQNLLSNAMKYTPEGGSVRLSAKVVEDADGKRALALSVSDTGFGIPVADQPRIFGKFFRGENVRLMGTDGTGLGMYVTKQVVELLKGRIWFDSKEGEGTTFHVQLPYEG